MRNSMSPAAIALSTASRYFDRLRRRARLFFRGESPRRFFDLHDARLVREVFTDAGHPPPAEPAPGAFERGERIYELHGDVRALFPFALTPFGRAAFLHWYIVYGRGELAASPDDLVAYLAELDATPDRGLVPTYLLRPDWQEQHPDALTPHGWGAFKRWLADEYGVTGRWFRRASLPPRYGQEQMPGPGVNLVGFFRYTSGLQQAVQSVANALSLAGINTELRDVPNSHARETRRREGFDGLERHPVTILNTGLDLSVPEVYKLAALHPKRDTYRVAVWWWELERLPADWLGRGADVDEIWAPTTFIATALKPLGKPIYPMLPSVRLPEFTPRPKEYFGLDRAKFTFLFVFDMNSRMPRKNPLALIRAFRRAFAPADPVELVVKVSPQEKFFPEWWSELRSAAAENGVRLIDKHVSRDDLYALMNAADAYVSLHRSEGLGLTMAEAMLLGKPTIATGYSGNLDIMTPSNSYLVKYERTTIAEATWPYPQGCEWAEPSVEHAAELMRDVFDHPEEAKAVGRRGRDEVTALLSPDVAGRRMAARLNEIAAGGFQHHRGRTT
ncbi:MAG TPA: glycosyltransferase family 4 protein [Gemmataceae bacterium]|nr:glycosyltransferase family 4 protein [Gemmataceae bacterium]